MCKWPTFVCHDKVCCATTQVSYLVTHFARQQSNGSHDLQCSWRINSSLHFHTSFLVSCCRYVTLSNIQSNASRGLLGNTTFISAGAVRPSAAEDTDANQCSLGELYRIGKRGGPFIATNADIPTASVYVRPMHAASMQEETMY